MSFPPTAGQCNIYRGAVQSDRRCRSLLGRYGAPYTLRRTGSKATFLVANPGGLTGDDHPFAAALPGDLAAAGVRVLAFTAP